MMKSNSPYYVTPRGVQWTNFYYQLGALTLYLWSPNLFKVVNFFVSTEHLVSFCQNISKFGLLHERTLACLGLIYEMKYLYHFLVISLMENGPNMTKLGVCLVIRGLFSNGIFISKKQQIVGLMSICDRSQYNIMLKKPLI